MKKIALFILVLVVPFTVIAQQWNELDVSKSSQTVSEIMKVVRGVKQLDWNFKQVKKSPAITQPVVSTGRMHYVAPDQVDWVYVTPENLTVKFKDNKISVFRDGTEQHLSPKQQMGLKNMMKMIVGMSNGSSLFDDRNFEWKLFENDGFYKVKMLPKNKNAKRMFVQIELLFDKKGNAVSSLEMTESDNSVTTITFSK